MTGGAVNLTTLSEVMDKINNHFIATTERGTFSIREGALLSPVRFLPGQYVLVAGSILNDGVCRVTGVEPADAGYKVSLVGVASDEDFTGAVCGLAVPRTFLELVADIADFQEKAKKEKRGLTGESFKNYSYQKATDAQGRPVDWPDAFADRLGEHRKMFPERVV